MEFNRRIVIQPGELTSGCLDPTRSPLHCLKRAARQFRRSLMAFLITVSTVDAIAAQSHPPCPPAPSAESSTISVDTKTAADLVTKLLGKVGIDINVKATRDNVLKDNPRADQVFLVLTMINVQCEMIWSDPQLSGGEKAARFQAMMKDILTPVLGPAPIARTDTMAHGFWYRVRLPFEIASTDEPMGLLLAENTLEIPLPTPQSGYLRDAPFYITDSNKYFVIVGSTRTQEAGLRLMKRLKAASPHYDFALYAPYGDNPHFGIMMASWVSRSLADEALTRARQDVAPDAYLWACRSLGERC